MMYEKTAHRTTLELSRKFTLVQSFKSRALYLCVSLPVELRCRPNISQYEIGDLLFHSKLLFLTLIQDIGYNSMGVGTVAEVSEVHSTSSSGSKHSTFLFLSPASWSYMFSLLFSPEGKGSVGNPPQRNNRRIVESRVFVVVCSDNNRKTI
jgi:hypothetical protein